MSLKTHREGSWKAQPGHGADWVSALLNVHWEGHSLRSNTIVLAGHERPANIIILCPAMFSELFYMQSRFSQQSFCLVHTAQRWLLSSTILLSSPWRWAKVSPLLLVQMSVSRLLGKFWSSLLKLLLPLWGILTVYCPCLTSLGCLASVALFVSFHLRCFSFRRSAFVSRSSRRSFMQSSSRRDNSFSVGLQVIHFLLKSFDHVILRVGAEGNHLFQFITSSQIPSFTVSLLSDKCRQHLDAPMSVNVPPWMVWMYVLSSSEALLCCTLISPKWCMMSWLWWHQRAILKCFKHSYHIFSI